MVESRKSIAIVLLIVHNLIHIVSFKFGGNVLSRDCNEVIKLLRMVVISYIRILSKRFRGMYTQDAATTAIFAIPNPIKITFKTTFKSNEILQMYCFVA